MQISLDVKSSGIPSFKEETLAPLIFLVASALNEFDEADDVKTNTLGPKGSGAMPFTNFETNDMFALQKYDFSLKMNESVSEQEKKNTELTASASNADRSDPSPNLFKAPNGGNSHSINGIFLGLLIAALIPLIAWSSLSFIEDGIFAADPDDWEPKLNSEREVPFML